MAFCVPFAAVKESVCIENKVAHEAHALTSSGIDTITCLFFIGSLGSTVR